MLYGKGKYMLYGLSVITLWLVSHVFIYQQPALLNQIITLLFFCGLAYEIEFRLFLSNKQLFFENKLLFKSRNAVLSMLNDISSSAEYMDSVDKTLARILETIAETLSVDAVALYSVVQDASGEKKLHFSEAVGQFYPVGAADDFVMRSPGMMRDHLVHNDFRMNQGLIGIVATEGKAIMLDYTDNAHKMGALGIHTRYVHNVLAAPLTIQNELFGVIVAQNVHGSSTFNPNDANLLQFLADQAGRSVNNTRMYSELSKTSRLRQEANIATKIQKQLLPSKIAEPTNLRMAIFFEPAKEVGGDYYDFIQHTDGSTGIVIGDVSGKGVPAGMVMAIAKVVVQILAPSLTDVKEIVVKFCREMYQNIQSGHFMTLNYLRWHGESRNIWFAGAGHEYILWFHRATGRCEKIRAGGLAAGLMEDSSALVKQGNLQLEQGDVLVLYTDGVTEARNGTTEMYSLVRLVATVESVAYLLNPDTIRDRIIQDVHQFIAGAEQYDDITLLVLSVVS
jgi:serine phosphatase RsbU (regulator of sigma subunit)